MFSRNLFLSLIFAFVVLCTTVPQVAVEAKDVDAFFQNKVEAVQQELPSPAIKGSSRVRRVLKDDKVATAPAASPSTATTTSFWDGIIAFFLQILPFLIKIFFPSAADEPATGA